MQDKEQQLVPDMEQQSGSQLGEEFIKTVGRNINNLRYADDTTLMAES